MFGLSKLMISRKGTTKKGQPENGQPNGFINMLRY